MPEPLRPIGILGGTFDPVHHGHLRLAEEAAEACALERVLLIPAASPNLRAAPATPAQHRLAMVRLAAQSNPRLDVDAREIARPGTSYTVDTLRELRADMGAERPLGLLLGADAFLRLPAWSRWRELFGLAHVVVAARPGYDLAAHARAAGEIAGEWQNRHIDNPRALAARPAGSIARIDIPLLEISATDLRARMSRGASVRYLLPDAVVDYIAAHRLYGMQ
jgi:nicotinate-nucleotide adenylyltransferase